MYGMTCKACNNARNKEHGKNVTKKKRRDKSTVLSVKWKRPKQYLVPGTKHNMVDISPENIFFTAFFPDEKRSVGLGLGWLG